MLIACSTMPIPAVLTKMPSPLPLSTTLVSPVTNCTPASARLHGLHDTAERFHRQTLFEDEGRAQVKRPRTAHGEVIDCPFIASVPISPPGKNSGLTT